jgi:hypothetical protein
MLNNIIDEVELQNSFFYPASEADLFPLMHFEYPAFIYVDFMYDMNFLDYDLKSKSILEGPDPYKVVDVHDYDLSDILNFNELDEAKEILKKVISENEINMMLADSDVYKKGRDIRVFDLQKSSGKKSKFIYIHYEGLLAYLLLFRKGRISPKVLCTTITGHAPALEKVFPLLLKELEVKPEIWISWNSKSNLYKYHKCKILWEGTCENLDADVYSRDPCSALFNIFGTNKY